MANFPDSRGDGDDKLAKKKEKKGEWYRVGSSDKLCVRVNKVEKENCVLNEVLVSFVKEWNKIVNGLQVGESR